MNKYIYERVKSFCDDNALIEKNDGIVAGISGGADSVFLVFVSVTGTKRI